MLFQTTCSIFLFQNTVPGMHALSINHQSVRQSVNKPNTFIVPETNHQDPRRATEGKRAGMWNFNKWKEKKKKRKVYAFRRS